MLDDYAATSNVAAYTARVQEVVGLFIEHGIEVEAARGMLSTPRWAMEQALVTLDKNYGGVEPYLLGPGGMSPRTLHEIRRTLIEEG